MTACKNPDDIIQAARFGDLIKLEGCIESGISVDHTDPAGETALFHVVGSGSSKAFELLIKNTIKAVHGNSNQKPKANPATAV